MRGAWSLSRVCAGASAVILTVVALACGGNSPTAPTPAALAVVSGTWDGRVRPRTLQGQCAADLTFLGGSDGPLGLTLSQSGPAVTGTVDVGVGIGTCDVAGTVGPTTLRLSTTSCTPRPQTIDFFVCDGIGSEMVLRSLRLELTVSSATATGTYEFTRDIRVPAGGSSAGVLTETGDVTLNRR